MVHGNTNGAGYTLDCFASWSEGSYTFIIAFSGNRQPQYVLVIICSSYSIYTHNSTVTVLLPGVPHLSRRP